MDWLTFFSSVIVAALTGTAASLLAPWSQWGVEKRKLKHTRRIKLIRACKIMLNKYRTGKMKDFRQSIEYQSLKNLLDEDVVKKLDAPLSEDVTIITAGEETIIDQGQIEKIKILEGEIKRLENEWGLV